MEEIEKLGFYIKKNRIESGLSQEELAQMCKIDRSQLSRIEQGLVDGVTYVTIAKIFKSLGIKFNDEIMSESIHPFVKWAGGKTQLLKSIVPLIPSKFNTYFEPFIGGGAVLFSILPRNFVINDLNNELISAYKCFTDSNKFNELIAELSKHEKEHSEDYYYSIRSLDRKNEFSKMNDSSKAARMIYLNKSDFNGLYRVNSKGFFNVPSGKKKKVKCFDLENFNLIKKYFSNSKATILCGDYKKSIEEASKGDFVYFDPPYDSFENKPTFTSYSKENFNKNNQIELCEIFKKLDKKGVLVMLSNHNTKFIRDLYKDFNIHIIEANRMINADAKHRGKVQEVIITNY